MIFFSFGIDISKVFVSGLNAFSISTELPASSLASILVISNSKLSPNSSTNVSLLPSLDGSFWESVLAVIVYLIVCPLNVSGWLLSKLFFSSAAVELEVAKFSPPSLLCNVTLFAKVLDCPPSNTLESVTRHTTCTSIEHSSLVCLFSNAPNLIRALFVFLL